MRAGPGESERPWPCGMQPVTGSMIAAVTDDLTEIRGAVKGLICIDFSGMAEGGDPRWQRRDQRCSAAAAFKGCPGCRPTRRSASWAARAAGRRGTGLPLSL